MSDMNIMLNIQRAIGRLEQGQNSNHDEFVRRFDDLQRELVAHKKEDDINFANINGSLGSVRIVNATLQNQDENTRMIGKWIIATLGSLALLVGSAVVAFISGHLKIQ